MVAVRARGTLRASLGLCGGAAGGLTFCITLRFSKASRTALPAAEASGLPPYVLAWSPGLKTSALDRAGRVGLGWGGCPWFDPCPSTLTWTSLDHLLWKNHLLGAGLDPLPPTFL